MERNWEKRFGYLTIHLMAQYEVFIVTSWINDIRRSYKKFTISYYITEGGKTSLELPLLVAVGQKS